MTIQEFTHVNFGNITVVTKDDDEKGITNCYTPGDYQDMLIISEPGLYKLIARSRKPKTRIFDR